MLRRGLRLVNVVDEIQQRRCHDTNIRVFKSHFRRHPLHLCRVWRDLQTTTIPEAKLTEEEAELEITFIGFMMAMYFLTCYDTFDNIGSLFYKHRNEASEMTWYYVAKVATLKSQKIVWPDDFDTIFIASLDGTHVKTNEPRDPNMRKNPVNYSHKFELPGVNVEIALHLWKQQVIHFKRADAASVHDLTAFRQELINKVPQGKLIIADSAYTGKTEQEKAILAVPNPLDSKEVRQFKDDARARHENFNQKLKEYKCLSTTARHGLDKLQLCLDACVVLCQYAIEDPGPDGEPLNLL